MASVTYVSLLLLNCTRDISSLTERFIIVNPRPTFSVRSVPLMVVVEINLGMVPVYKSSSCDKWAIFSKPQNIS